MLSILTHCSFPFSWSWQFESNFVSRSQQHFDLQPTPQSIPAKAMLMWEAPKTMSHHWDCRQQTCSSRFTFQCAVCNSGLFLHSKNWPCTKTTFYFYSHLPSLISFELCVRFCVLFPHSHHFPKPGVSNLRSTGKCGPWSIFVLPTANSKNWPALVTWLSASHFFFNTSWF